MVVRNLYFPSSFDYISAVLLIARDMVIHFKSSYCFSLTAEETELTFSPKLFSVFRVMELLGDPHGTARHGTAIANFQRNKKKKILNFQMKHL